MVLTKIYSGSLTGIDLRWTMPQGYTLHHFAMFNHPITQRNLLCFCPLIARYLVCLFAIFLQTNYVTVIEIGKSITE